MNHAQLIDHLLLRLDSRFPGIETLAPEDIEEWPQGAFNHLSAQGIMLADAPATIVTCDACSEDHVEEVEVAEYPTEPKLRYFITCPSYGRVEVSAERLRRWRLDLGGLAKATGRLLGTVGEPKEIVSRRVWDLGWAEIGGTVRDFMMVRGLGWPDNLDISPLLTGRNSPIVLTLCEMPGVALCDTPAVPLSRVLFLDDTGLSLDVRYLGALPAQEKRISLPPIVQEDYAFMRKGRLWVARFEGRQSVFPHLDGFRYIAYLLASPNREVSAVELAQLGKPKAQVAASDSHEPSSQEMIDEGMSVSGFGDAGEKLDNQAIREYREGIRKIDLELAKLDAIRHASQIDKLRKDKVFLQKELGSAVGMGGRKRKASSAIERARTTVRHRIETALLLISEQDLALAKFLTNSIRTGNFCMYHPDRNISWRLDLLKTRHP